MSNAFNRKKLSNYNIYGINRRDIQNKLESKLLKKNQIIAEGLGDTNVLPSDKIELMENLVRA